MEVGRNRCDSNEGRDKEREEMVGRQEKEEEEAKESELGRKEKSKWVR